MGFLEEASMMFENSINLAQANFISESVFEIFESCNEDQIYVEKGKDSLGVSIKKFFAKLITAFQNLHYSIKIEVDKKVRSVEFQNKLRSLHTELKEAKKDGNKNVSVIDIWTLREKYLETVKELKQYSKKITKMNYSKTSEIDDDIKSFNSTMEKYKEELETLSKKTVTVSLDRMIDFVEDEISGQSKVLNSLNDAIALLEQMNKDCIILEKRKDILGPDVLVTKRIGFIRRIATSISSFFKKWAVKIITTFVLIVG